MRVEAIRTERGFLILMIDGLRAIKHDKILLDIQLIEKNCRRMIIQRLIS